MPPRIWLTWGAGGDCSRVAPHRYIDVYWHTFCRAGVSMNGPEHNGMQQPETPSLMSRVQHRLQRPDEMDRIVQEAQEDDLLHGKLGRTILRNYGLHKSVRWGMRTDVVGIVGVLIIVPAILLNVPQPILMGLIVVWLLAGAATVLAMVVSLVRAYTIHTPPEAPTNHAGVATASEEGQNHALRGAADCHDAG